MFARPDATKSRQSTRRSCERSLGWRTTPTMTTSHPPNPLTPLLSTPHPPALIYLHHPYHAHAALPALPALAHAVVVVVDAGSAPTPRALYTAIARDARRLVHRVVGGGDGDAAQVGKDVVRFDG